MKHILGFCLLLGTSYSLTVDLDNFRSIIEEVNALNTTWKANTDMPDEMTISYFRGLLGTLPPERHLRTSAGIDLPDMAIPAEFDARTEWPHCPTISQIRDQGSCSSCWAVAAVAAFSDRLCIATNGSHTLPLSAEEVIACCEDCAGCYKGYAADAWEFFVKTGLVTGGEFQSGIGCQPNSVCIKGQPLSCPTERKTPDCQRKCTNPNYTTPFEQDHHKVVSAYSIYGEKNIQKEVLTYGPVQVTFYTYADFYTYKSGVYQKTTGSEEGVHSGRLFGWGTEEGTPYWLVANSWATRWGDNGLIKFRRGTNECGIERMVTAGIPSLERSLTC